MVLTPAQAAEEVHHAYRTLDYKDCGRFVINIPGQEQPMELFFSKAI